MPRFLIKIEGILLILQVNKLETVDATRYLPHPLPISLNTVPTPSTSQLALSHCSPSSSLVPSSPLSKVVSRCQTTLSLFSLAEKEPPPCQVSCLRHPQRARQTTSQTGRRKTKNRNHGSNEPAHGHYPGIYGVPSLPAKKQTLVCPPITRNLDGSPPESRGRADSSYAGNKNGPTRTLLGASSKLGRTPAVGALGRRKQRGSHQRVKLSSFPRVSLGESRALAHHWFDAMFPSVCR